VIWLYLFCYLISFIQLIYYSFTYFSQPIYFSFCSSLFTTSVRSFANLIKYVFFTHSFLSLFDLYFLSDLIMNFIIFTLSYDYLFIFNMPCLFTLSFMLPFTFLFNYLAILLVLIYCFSFKEFLAIIFILSLSFCPSAPNTTLVVELLLFQNGWVEFY
jgi:hypothetical protein